MLADLRRRNPFLYWTGVAHLALLALFLLFSLLDTTQILGINRWIKPMKFMTSIAIFVWTMGWVLEEAGGSPRARRWVSWLLGGTLFVETICIVSQAARGVRSHFNRDTTYDEAVFALMGIMIVVNTLAAAWALLLMFRARPQGAKNAAYVWGIRLGLVLFIIFASEGGLMVRQDAHAVGVPDGGPGLPFVNWSTEGGDLRAAHFLGMHALQALPLLGWLTASLRAVWAAFAAWGALALWVLLRALAGSPLLRL